MSRFDARKLAALGVLPLFLALAACGEAPEPTTTVELTGTIALPEGTEQTGTVHVGLMHVSSLDGVLRHPRREIEWFEATAGTFTHTFAYPTERGEGLLVYAWLDSDGDGVHCTPTTNRAELAGMVKVANFPAKRVTVDIPLTQPCASPDWFYPPGETGASADAAGSAVESASSAPETPAVVEGSEQI